MNQTFLNNINQALIKTLKERYNMDDANVLNLSDAGKNSLINSLKQYVLKNGTPEIEAILLEKKQFSESPLQNFCFTNFKKDIAGKRLLNEQQTTEVAEFSINFLIDQFREGFKNSGNTKDLDGICLFLGIDKNLVSLANSPMAKMFGKFF